MPDTDIPRLTDDELDAVIGAHQKRIETCWACGEQWPCETWNLATEVKELRAVVTVLKDAGELMELIACGADEHTIYQEAGDWSERRTRMLSRLARYEEGGR